MRIVLDLQACQASSMNRGIGRYSLALALAMTRHSGAHDLRIVVNNGFQDSAIALRKTFGTVDSFATPLPTAEGNPDNRWRLLAAERIREHYLASLQPDVVHVTSLFEGFGDNSVNSVLHGDGRFDTAVTLYDLIPLLRKERYLDDPNIAAWYYRKLESLKQAELLLAISAHARDEAIVALGLAPGQVVNISSAADAIFVPRDVAADARAALFARAGLRRPFIMYTGGIDYRKNIEGLIAAYAALPGHLRQQFQLAIVCSIHAPDRVRLQRLAARLGLAADDLVLTGFVADDDLVALYSCTALFVFPSLHEGFGLPVLEAMACGAPVIGSNTSSIPEVLGRADAMFDPNSVPAITAAMARVLGDPAHAQALRVHGLAQAKLFSWDASAKRAIAAFEAAHARRAGQPVRADPAEGERRLVQALAALGPAGATDYVQAAAAIAGNRPRTGAPQLLVDVTRQDAGDRAAAAVPHWRIAPVRHDGKRYRYADDTVADAGMGDILLGDAATIFPPAWHARGVQLQYRDGHTSVAALLAALPPQRPGI
jgi:glycosyltransferase involved in cell wall biosynthesis